MSTYLGFEPTDKAGYYFISYNTEDAERISPIVTALMHSDAPLWYDYGIEYGDQWAPQINEKLNNSQAVLLFFTKGILQKVNSYVKKEYKMAKDYLNKKVYIIMLDEITPKDVPINMLDWWIDISSEQCIPAFNRPHDEKLIEEIKKALGIETQEKRMNMLIQNYKKLYEAGKNDEAELYFSEYLSGKTMQTKAELFVNIASESNEGIVIDERYLDVWFHEYDKSSVCAETKLDWEIICSGFKNGLGESVNPLSINLLDVNGNRFVAGNIFLFHRGIRGDAHILQLLRDGEIIYTVGGLIEVSKCCMYYDKNDDLLYIAYNSQQEEMQQGECISTSFWSAVVISDPLGAAIAKRFDNIKQA